MKNIIGFVAMTAIGVGGIVGACNQNEALLASTNDEEAVEHGLKMFGCYGLVCAAIVAQTCLRHRMEEE